MLLGLVLLVLGAFALDSDRGRILLVCGMALGSLGGLDTALREHLSGFRSHTRCSSALPGVLAAGVLFFARAPWIVVSVGAVLVFSAAFARLAPRVPRPGSQLGSHPWNPRSACSCVGCTTSRRSAATSSARSRSTATCSGWPWSTTAPPTTIRTPATCGSAPSTAPPGGW